MRRGFWRVLPLLALSCAAPEADRYEPQACEQCDWVVPFGSNVDVERLVADGSHVYSDDQSQLWQHPKQGGEREAVVLADGALFPSRPAVIGDEIAWCAQAGAGVNLFRYSKHEGVVIPQLLTSEEWCPELLVVDAQLFGFSDRDGGTLTKFGVDGPSWASRKSRVT